MSDQRICIVSGDDHAGAPMKQYREYLEKWLHPAFDEYYSHHVSRFSTTDRNGSFFAPEFNSKFWDTEGYDPELGTPIAWDPDLRLKAMDDSMIACSVLFPDDTNSNDPPWGAGLATAFQDGGAIVTDTVPAPLVRAGARAFNRWLADFCSADRDRLRGLIILGTTEDMVWCLDEVYRAYESGLTAGLMLPLEHEQPMFHHPRYDMLWEACCELDLPVISHIGRGHPSYVGEDPFVQSFFYGYDLMANCRRPVAAFIMGGVLERFPTLRVAVSESNVDWVAPTLAQFEASFKRAPMQARRAPSIRVDYSLRPTEYWKRQCYVVHSIFQRPEDFQGEAYDKVPNMVFGADMCHPEGWWPVFGMGEPRPAGFVPGGDAPATPIREAFDLIFGALPAANVVPYLQDNFFSLFRNVDRDALKSTAERIGPTAADLRLIP